MAEEPKTLGNARYLGSPRAIPHVRPRRCILRHTTYGERSGAESNGRPGAARRNLDFAYPSSGPSPRPLVTVLVRHRVRLVETIRARLLAGLFIGRAYCRFRGLANVRGGHKEGDFRVRGPGTVEIRFSSRRIVLDRR